MDQAERRMPARGKSDHRGKSDKSRKSRRSPPDVAIRPAEEGDLRSIAALAGDLVRMHHAVDKHRFLLPEDVESGYAWWLGKERKSRRAVVLVAEVGGKVVGYCYGTRAGRDWNMLLDEHGALHDVFVSARTRKKGVGRALVTAMVERLTALGAPRVVLSTMVSNLAAQKLFASCGFRPTMLEMTR